MGRIQSEEIEERDGHDHDHHRNPAGDVVDQLVAVEHVHDGIDEGAQEREEIDEGREEASVTPQRHFARHYDQGHIEQAPTVAAA